MTRMVIGWIVAGAWLCSSGIVYASDGVSEINGACAAVGCFPGDAASFPITITQSGSYRLTSNLDVPANTTAIRIEAPNVSLDLAGFEVRSTTTCTGYPPTGCSPNGGASGIFAPSSLQFYVTVRNGVVRGFSGPCINLTGNSHVVESVSVYYCTGSGIRTGAYGRVSSSRVSNVSASAITLADGGTGITIGDGGAAHDNEIRGVSGLGIFGEEVFHGGSISGNRLFDIGSAGIFGSLSNGVAIGRLLLSENVFAGVSASGYFSGYVHSMGNNLCANSPC